MNKVIVIALTILGISTFTNAQNTILEALGRALGTAVSVNVIVTLGPDRVSIR